MSDHLAVLTPYYVFSLLKLKKNDAGFFSVYFMKFITSEKRDGYDILVALMAQHTKLWRQVTAACVHFMYVPYICI